MAHTESFAYETTLAMFEQGDTATMENSAQKGILEALIDRFTLPVILSALADMCSGKAAHINDNWQDAVTAKTWERNSLECNKAAMKVSP